MRSKAMLYPSLTQRIGSVWYRHMRVYAKNLISNGFPPFLEPLFFLAAFGIGFAQYMVPVNGMPYLQFLATGLLVTSSMFTASYECTYATYVRLEFDKVYDGMIAAPITAANLFIGEMIWCGTKGLFFSLAVLIVMYGFSVLPVGFTLLAPLLGFVTGFLFSALSLFITSFVRNMNYFNFYFTGILTPMFFFSGVMFPVSSLPLFWQYVAEALPLTHCIRLIRSVCFSDYSMIQLWDGFYLIAFGLLFTLWSIKRLKKRLID